MVHGNTKCLSADSAEPVPKSSTSLVLYSMRFCPFAERARLVLAAKEIQYEIVNINLRSKPDWFLKKNPLATVPIFQEEGGKKLTSESLIVSEYIDDKFQSGLKLLPTDLYERARQKMLIEWINQKFLTPYGQVQFKGGEENTKVFFRGLEEVEAMLTDNFFAGPNVSFVDLMVFPWIWRMKNLKELRGLDIPDAKYPKMLEWTARMYEFPFVKDTVYPLELTLAFAINYIVGKPNYDEGL